MRIIEYKLKLYNTNRKLWNTNRKEYLFFTDFSFLINYQNSIFFQKTRFNLSFTDKITYKFGIFIQGKC